VLANLHGNGDKHHPKALAEYHEIQEALQLESAQSTTSYQELAKPRIAKRVFLGMSLQMWSQLSGMNVMSMSQPLRLHTQTTNTTPPKQCITLCISCRVPEPARPY
jgi:hypothetical protein